MLGLLVTVVLFQFASGAFFDLTDVDDPLSLLWNNRPAFGQRQRNSECRAQTPIGPVYGVCQNPSLCIFSGGKPNGICGILATCCTYESSCGKVTNTKVSYFQRSGNDYFGNQECSYEVFLSNPNICQIRLDFESFNIAPSTQTSVSKCDSDRLLIHPNHYDIPELCGNNDNQHVYVHVNQTSGTRKVNLKMILLSNMNPTWKIKVTQLECPGLLNTDDAATDFHMLAPLGAIQYFTQQSGFIKSFGYDANRNLNSYTSNEKYAMAFKRSEKVCGIKFTVNYLNMPDDKSTVIRDKMCTSDYLFVPNVQFIDKSHDVIAKICSSKHPKDVVFETVSPGPLSVIFQSSPKFTKALGNGPNAFYIKYDLMTSCS